MAKHNHPHNDEFPDLQLPDPADDQAMREFGRQLAMDGLLRDCLGAAPRGSGDNSGRNTAPELAKHSHSRRWLIGACGIAACAAAILLLPNMWRPDPHGLTTDARQKIVISGWDIQSRPATHVRIADPNVIELTAGELSIESVADDAKPITVITPNSTFVSAGAKCLIGVHQLTNTGGPSVIPRITRVLVLSGLATLANNQGSMEVQAEQLVQVTGNKAPVVMTVDYNTDFAVDIYQRLVADDEGNVFISPYSISTALAMLIEGARGETAEELGQLLHFPPSTRRTTNDAQRIPWETAKLYTGITRLNEILGQGGTAGNSKAQAAIDRINTELKSVRDEVKSLERDPPDDLAELIQATAKNNQRYVQLTRQRRKLTKGTPEYEQITKEINTLRDERKQLRNNGRASMDVDMSPLREKEATLVKQFNTTLKSMGGYRLDIANALWAEKSLSFEPTYIDTVSDAFQTGGLMPADFLGRPDAERERINAWIEQQTNHRIRDFLEPNSITRDTGLVVTNAIYFLGEWKYPFDTRRTSRQPFTLSDSSTTKTSMMSKRYFGHGGYGAINGDGSVFVAPKEYDENNPPQLYPDEEGFHLVSLPYRGDDVSMILIAPMRHDGLARLEKQLSSENLAAWIKALQRRKTHVFVPKFRLEESYELRDTLEQLGLRSAFVRPTADGGADFTGIADVPWNRQLFMSRVAHKTFVEVNERGTEAAAVTLIQAKKVGSAAVRLVPFIPEFKADRPFMFLIRHNKTGAILFMGRMMSPQA